MDIKPMTRKLTELFKKYKYAALILVVGLVLMLMPTDLAKDEAVPQITQAEENRSTVSRDLAKILGSIEGVGRVEVMLTVSSGPQTVYQTDKTQSQGSNEGSSRQETVIITDSNRNEIGLVTQVLSETYQGAIIVCQGAGSPSVQLAVMEAVSNATGLSSDRICVLKMK